MTIAQRLVLLIGVAVLGLLLVGGFGLRQMGLIDENLKYAHENSIPSIRAVAVMQATFLRVRVRMLSLMVAPEDKKAEMEARLHEERKRLDQAVKAYEPLVSDDKDRVYLDVSKRLVAEYSQLVEDSATATARGDLEKARAGMSRAAEISRQLGENLDAHGKYNESLAETEVKKADAAYSSGKIVVVSVILLATLVTVVLGFLVHRHVVVSLGNMVTLFARVETELDFRGRVPVEGRDEVAQASTAFNRLLDRLQGSFREIGNHTVAVNEAASRVATASRQMSIASSHQSEAASSMAATVEEMTVSINHVSDRAQEASQTVAGAGTLARDGGRIIGQTVSDINGISETVRVAADQIGKLEQQSERINAVVAVIKEVADQTNLLALNAAIEAARAGEQGRGFAVVADEVRKLAERTTNSTQEIAATIAEMQNGAQQAVQGIRAVVEKVDTGVSRAESANGAISQIGQSSSAAVDMVGDISDAIREQSVASTNIAQQVEKIAQMSEENSAAIQSTSDTALELARLSSEMEQVVRQYKV